MLAAILRHPVWAWLGLILAIVTILCVLHPKVKWP